MFRTLERLAPSFLCLSRVFALVPSHAYLIDPAGKLAGERSDSHQGDFHEKK
jgi:hypothetical protein